MKKAGLNFKDINTIKSSLNSFVEDPKERIRYVIGSLAPRLAISAAFRAAINNGVEAVVTYLNRLINTTPEGEGKKVTLRILVLVLTKRFDGPGYPTGNTEGLPFLDTQAPYISYETGLSRHSYNVFVVKMFINIIVGFFRIHDSVKQNVVRKALATFYMRSFT